MKKIKSIILPLLLALPLLVGSAMRGDNVKETERINNSAKVLKDFSGMKESIPHELIAKYEGIVVVPNLINAGLLVGGKRGKGIAIVKLDNGKWSDPVFITLTAGSLGAQIGVQSIDLVLVFRHKGVLAKVKNGDFTIGGDASAAAGPVGRTTSANTDYKLEAEIYSYSRSRGLFAGVSINGSSLAIDKTSNKNYYGDDANPQEIFASDKNDTAAVKTLKETLASL